MASRIMAATGASGSAICPNPSLLPALGELERLYRAVAPAFGLARHPMPRIVIQTGGRKQALGWYRRKSWQPRDHDGFSGVDEITIVAEFLSEPISEAVTTLLHEMVHHACHLDGVRDTSSKGAYHNVHFKLRAERAGMIVGERQGRHGWSDVRPGPKLRPIIKALDLDETAFQLARVESPRTVRLGMTKWVCRCPVPQVLRWQRKDPMMAVCIWCLRRAVSEAHFEALMEALEDVQFYREG